MSKELENENKDIIFVNGYEYVRVRDRFKDVLKPSKEENAKLKGQVNYLTEVATEYQKILKIIKEKGFDESIKNYDNYAIWVEYKTEQFAKAIEKNPTIFNRDVFDKVIYTEEEFDLLKR